MVIYLKLKKMNKFAKKLLGLYAFKSFEKCFTKPECVSSSFYSI